MTPPSQTIYINGLPETWADHPASFDLGLLAALSFIYLALAIYLGALSAGAPLYFPLLPSWWGCSETGGGRGGAEEGDRIALLRNASAAEGSITVHKLSKAYKQTQALKEVSLTLRPSTLTALLGQNGAGKSTLIGLLSGLSLPTHGSMFALGHSIADEMGILRDVMGSCPQDDLLWEELSPAQHLALFGAFKGLARRGLKESVEESLQRVSLLQEAHNTVSSFSGGMKRRLSVALSSIGAPKIIFFDEPCSGIDPLARRAIWDIIESLKPGRILVLCTHSMEEADALADNVAMLAGGKLRAFGTPLALKAAHGSGYSISIIANPARVGDVKALVKAYVPEAHIVGDGDASQNQQQDQQQQRQQQQQIVVMSSLPDSAKNSIIAMPNFVTLANPSSIAASTIATAGSQPPSLNKNSLQTSNASASAVIRRDGDVLRNKDNLGSLTISVPQSSLHLIPPFLRLLSKMATEDPRAGVAPPTASGGGRDVEDPRVIREWGLSLSSLEEVFLKLAARERDSGNLAEDAGGGGGGGRAGGGKSQERRMCALCEAAPTAPVTVYTQKQLEVFASDLLCLDCASRDAEQVRQVKTTLAAQRQALLESLTMQAPPSNDPIPPPNATTAVKNPLRALAALESQPTASSAGLSGVGGGFELPRPLWSTTALPASADSLSPGRAGGSGKKGAPSSILPPVSFFAQCYAILILISRISAPSSCTCRGIFFSRACINIALVLVAIIVTAVTGASTSPISLTQCPNGYWVENYTNTGGPSLCNRDTFITYMTGAVQRTNSNANWFGEARSSTLSSSFPSSSPSANSTHRTTAEVGVAPASYGAYVTPTAILLYKDYCENEFDTPPCYLSPGPFRSLDITAFAQSNYGGSDRALAMLGISDAAAAAAAQASGAAYVPFGDLDFLGGGLNASEWGHPLVASNLSSIAATSADINAWLLSTMGTVRSNLVPLNGTCAYAGPSNSNGDSNTGYIVGDDLAWAAQNMPSAGVAISRLEPSISNVGGPAFAYDLRVLALHSSGRDTYTPYRGNKYTYLYAISATQLTPYQCHFAAVNAYLQDTPLASPMSGNAYQSSALNAYLTINALDGAFLRASLATVPGVPAAAAAAAYIHTALVPLPDLTWIPAAGYTPASPYSTLVWPLFTMTTLPGIVAFLSSDRAEKLWALMAMSGVRRGPYLFAHWLTGFVSFLPVGITYIVVGWLAGSPSFRLPSPVLFLALLSVWAYAQASWGIFFGAIFSRPNLGSILCYILAIIVAVANLLLTSFVTPWPTYLTWIPFLSYARASTLILGTSGLPSGDAALKIAEALGITALEGTIALLLGAYFHAILPGPEQTGIALSPLFPLSMLQKLFARCCTTAGGSGQKRRARQHQASSWEIASPPSLDDDDVDLAQERSHADTCADAARGAVAGSGGRAVSSSTPAVILSDLRKYYSASLSTIAAAWLQRNIFPCLSCCRATRKDGRVVYFSQPKRAVDGISLTVSHGETLGLLGPNGAGKTTMLSIITGAASATSGDAYIKGMDVVDELSSVWRCMGVCPQFDCVWSELSVRSHLEFYARAKGVEPIRINAAVQVAAEKVGLDGDCFNMAARTLSGGQRRRLSIAIALLANPDVVFLDEPTTGLDVEQKHSIHRILAAEKRAGRAMIFCSHDLDEVDVLCDRIAILADGRLRAIGNQQHLKHRFGSGYKLTLHLDAPAPALLDATAARAHAFVLTKISPLAKLVGRVGTTLTYMLPNEGGFDVAGAFASLDTGRAKRVDGFIEFGLQQTSLEDVFVSVVRRATASSSSVVGGEGGGRNSTVPESSENSSINNRGN